MIDNELRLLELCYNQGLCNGYSLNNFNRFISITQEISRLPKQITNHTDIKTFISVKSLSQEASMAATKTTLNLTKINKHLLYTTYNI